MPKRTITSEQDSEIRRLGEIGKTVYSIAKQLKISYSTIHTYMVKHNIERKIDEVKRKNFTSDKRIERRKSGRIGYFNEHERENWLA